jgi:hypothetical protein
MAKRLHKEEMVKLVENVIHPKGKGYSADDLNQQLLLFCVNCPDPVGAMDLVIETSGPITALGLVEAAMALPPRDVATLSEAELANTHPLRHMKLDDA